MATTTYFEKLIVDADDGKSVHVDLGKTNYAGEGPQVYLRVGDESLIFSHADAKAFAEAVADLSRYFSDWPDVQASSRD